jgi:MFS family permease
MVHHLNGGKDFVWIGSAYTLGASSMLPVYGALAGSIGRRFTLLLALFFFALGSAIAGAAPTMNVLIAGRGMQHRRIRR